MDDLVDNHTTGNIIFVYHKPFKRELEIDFEYKLTFKICETKVTFYSQNLTLKGL